MKRQTSKRAITFAIIAAFGFAAQAADWSDTYIDYRYGTKFAEPFNPNVISKNIINLSHVSGYKYGTNFFNAELLFSDDKDPSAFGSKDGAHDAYVLYRHTLDLGKISGNEYKFGPIRGIGFTAGFDVSSKTDAGYNSVRRMLVAGPTLMMDVPGFLNVSLLELWDSNAPHGVNSDGIPYSVPRYKYKVHPMINLVWNIPLEFIPLSFEGFANFVASKGKDEFNANTAAETFIDMQIMYDLSPVLGASKNTFKLGFEYQYWKNKFGKDSSGPAGKGAFAKTPIIRVEYHF